MTNIDIIKYLATNNPARLAELLDDIYCSAWNCGSCAGSTGKIMEECEINDFGEWINQEANTNFFFEHELEEWFKAINNPLTLTAFYDGLTVTFPVKDPDHMWNNNNKYDYEVNK